MKKFLLALVLGVGMLVPLAIPAAADAHPYWGYYGPYPAYYPSYGGYHYHHDGYWHHGYGHYHHHR